MKKKKDPVFAYNVGITVMLMALLWELKLIKKFPQRDGMTEVFHFARVAMETVEDEGR